MRILYAVQKTGNGHLARAQEIIPVLREFGTVDVLASGSQSQINPAFEIKYNFRGISLYYSNSGRISIPRTILKNNLFQFIRDLLRVPVGEYDLIINDFEPVTAWACKFLGGNLLAVSHQASLWSDKVPRPALFNRLAYALIRYYAPASKSFGFHFKRYDHNIFYPVIRRKIRELTPSTENKIVVYLPAYSTGKMIQVFSGFDERWVIFSKDAKAPYSDSNCAVYPVHEKEFMTELASCKGVLCGAGFELPAEALYLGKKLFVIPIQLQQEQYFNEASLNDLGVPSSHHLDRERIAEWLLDDTRVMVNYDTDVRDILREVIASAMEGKGEVGSPLIGSIH